MTPWFLVEATPVEIKRSIEGWLVCPEDQSTISDPLTAQRAGWLACPAVVDRDRPIPMVGIPATVLFSP
jgi:hypothetical protein